MLRLFFFRSIAEIKAARITFSYRINSILVYFFRINSPLSVEKYRQMR